jgi:ribosome-associated protein
VPGDSIHIRGSVQIPRSEIDVITTTSGGPGGQHANRAATKVELRYDIASSTALSEAQRRRVIDRIGPELRVSAGDERSRARNLALAEQRLVDRLRAALDVPPPRRATRATRASKERRLSAKQRRSQLKSHRRRPRDDD